MSTEDSVAMAARMDAAASSSTVSATANLASPCSSGVGGSDVFAPSNHSSSSSSSSSSGHNRQSSISVPSSSRYVMHYCILLLSGLLQFLLIYPVFL